jgi:hypothetical protein
MLLFTILSEIGSKGKGPIPPRRKGLETKSPLGVPPERASCA